MWKNARRIAGRDAASNRKCGNSKWNAHSKQGYISEDIARGIDEFMIRQPLELCGDLSVQFSRIDPILVLCHMR
jgi:hypothetical protein